MRDALRSVDTDSFAFTCFTIVVCLGLLRDVSAQPTFHSLEAGEYAVGFRLVEERDETRAVAGPTFSPRPVRVYLWYPADAPSDTSSMRFARYAELAEGDAWSADDPREVHEKLRFSRYALARSLGPEGFEALGEARVRAFENAEPRSGPFPLVVIGQGLYYESPVAFAALAEYLAGRGFVVASPPLMGTHTPLVKLDVEDLETQIRDLELVIARVRALAYVSDDELGVMGYDMGGMAGLVLTMRNPDVDAFASVESGVLYPHPSGIPAASPDYDPAKLRVPWLHVWPSGRAPSDDTPSLFDTAVNAERYFLRVDGVNHVDPTSYGLVEGRGAMPGMWPPWSSDGVERNVAMSRYVLEFFSAFLTNRAESLAFLSREPPPDLAASGMAMEHRSASEPPTTYAEFVNAILAGNADSAIEDVRQLRDVHPDHMLLSDFYLYRLAYSLLYSWGLPDESMQLAKLNVELNPDSTLATQILSMNHVERREYDAAIDVYRKLQELRPGDETITRTLEWLQGQLEAWKNRN